MEAEPVTRRFWQPSGRLVRWGAPVLYVVVLVVFIYLDGIPASRERLLVWIVLGLLAFSTTNVRGWAGGVLFEWLPLALVLWAYDLLRGAADGLFFDAHVTPQIDAEKLVFFGTVPTVWLQEHLWDGPLDLHWYDYAAWLVYVSYFLATYLLAPAFGSLRASASAATSPASRCSR